MCVERILVDVHVIMTLLESLALLKRVTNLLQLVKVLHRLCQLEHVTCKYVYKGFTDGW